jgi:hypothetical protein
MKRLVNWCAAALMAGLLAFGLGGRVQAAPVSAGGAALAGVGADQGASLIAQVGYYRRHHRRVVYRGYHRPVVYHRRVVYHRPVRYRPIYARPVYARPVYVGRPVYRPRPRCVIRYRWVQTWQGPVRQAVRVCRW